MNRKRLIGLLFISSSILACIVIGLCSLRPVKKEEKTAAYSSNRRAIARSSLKSLKPSLRYTDSFPDLTCTNLVMVGDVGKYGVDGIQGKILRVLRFQNVSDAVERRYNLPRHIILAMMMEESSGVDLLPNALGDGGFGLCHMQASVAREFNLRVYKNCKALVCNGKDRRSCQDAQHRYCNHALELKELIIKNGSNRRLVIEYDDRLNPVINLDAVGRMLAYYRAGPRYGDLTPFQTAILRYAGKYNYAAYWRDVSRNMDALASDELIAKLEKRFNALNPILKINGSFAGFKEYIALSQQQNYNYGLNEYEKLPLYDLNK